MNSIVGRSMASSSAPEPRCMAALRMAGAPLALAVLLALPGPVAAFDTAPHFDMTEDALRPMALSSSAIATVQVGNYLVDFHEFMGNKDIRGKLDKSCYAQLDSILRIGDELQHFDDLDDKTQVAQRWDAMLEATRTTAMSLEASNDVLGLLLLFGMSLHNVQDFYAHSNWVEKAPQGPGIGQGDLKSYGSHPTWLSVDRATREKLNIYTRGSRTHGKWNSPDDAMNKDWPGREWAGRPYYSDAYVCAYFATVQWAKLFRSSFVSSGTWQAMQSWAGNSDVEWGYARKISFYGGHWNGNGEPKSLQDFLVHEPGTSPELLVKTVIEYMGKSLCLTEGRSEHRRKVERLLSVWGTWGRGKRPEPVDPTRLPKPTPETVTFAKLQVHRIDAIDTGDGIPEPPGLPARIPGAQMDWYANVRLGEQDYKSGLIDERDNFNFDQKPYAPWTMIKAMPSRPMEEEMVSLLVKLTTGTDKNAGTDSKIVLQLGGPTMPQRFITIPTLKADLENGSTKTFCLTVPPGIVINRIQSITVFKPNDDDDDGWQLAAIEVTANGMPLYANSAVNTRLNNQVKQWTANLPKAPSATSTDATVVMDLWELDYPDADDHEDINPHARAWSLGFVYSFASNQVRGDVNGPARFTSAGGGDKDRAKIEVSMSTIKATSNLPDLVIPRGAVTVQKP